MRKWVKRVGQASIVAVSILLVGWVFGLLLWCLYLVYTSLMATPPEWGKAVFGVLILVWFFGGVAKGVASGRAKSRIRGADPIN